MIFFCASALAYHLMCGNNMSDLPEVTSEAGLNNE
jgi:hypothetical protein